MDIDPSDGNPRNSEGAFALMEGGDVLLAYSRFLGGGADNSAAQISARSASAGEWEWTPDRILVDTEGRENVMSVSIIGLASNRILLFYLVKNGWGDCRPYFRETTDEFRTLEARREIASDPAYYVVNNDRAIVTASGRIIIPAALHPCPDGTRATWSHRGISLCFYSDDGGATWKRSRTELNAPPESKSGLQEPGVVELSDGRLMMWARTDLGSQFMSYSSDGGETWAEAKPGNLASPLSPASIKRAPWDGRLLAVWNDHSGLHKFPQGRRTPLCVAVSEDDGKTWAPSKVVEDDPDGWHCYTAIAFPGESVLLAYCAGDRKIGGLNRLRVTLLERTWLP